jgi:hypothetical protein
MHVAYREAMRGVLWLLLLTLLVSSEARAQPAEAPPPARSPVLVQSCYAVLTVYGFLPVCTATPVDPVELDRRVKDYLTNGAGVMAAPSAGPAAAYFHDASKVLAAPTTSWVPTFPASAPSTSAGAAPVTPTSPSFPDRGEAPPPPASAPAAAGPATPPSTTTWAVDETPPPAPSAEVAPSAHELRAGGVPTPMTPPSSPAAQAATTPASTEMLAPAPAPRRLVQPWWAALVSGVVVGAGMLFLAGRLVGRRLRTVHRRGA